MVGTDPAPRLQVVVAHPDDETFGCGGLLLHAAAAGFDTFVTCATRGEAGEDAHGRRGEALGAVRADELRRAADVLAVTEVELLDFADSGMTGPAPAGSLASTRLDAIVAALTTAVRRVRPDIVVTLDASDGHRDHVRVREATLVAAAAEGVPTVYLSCLPASLMQRWVAWTLESQPQRQHVTGDDVPVLGTPDAEITTLLDVRGHRDRLARAMAEHASQDSPYGSLPQDLRDAFLDVARARRVVPAWEGGAPEHALAPGRAGDHPMRTTTPIAVAPLHVHGRRCWWNHLEARWSCGTTTG